MAFACDLFVTLRKVHEEKITDFAPIINQSNEVHSLDRSIMLPQSRSRFGLNGLEISTLTNRKKRLKKYPVLLWLHNEAANVKLSMIARFLFYVAWPAFNSLLVDSTDFFIRKVLL